MAQLQNKTVRRSGYIYGPETAEGFNRMKRLGIPRPIFAIEDKLRKILKKRYARILRGIISDFREQLALAGVKIKDNTLTQDEKDEDTLQELLDFFEEMGRQEQEAKNAQINTNLRVSIGSVTQNLENQWNQEDYNYSPDPELAEKLGAVLFSNQADYTQRLQADASEALKHILYNFSIDKQKLYNANMAELRRRYLDNSVQRINEEESWLKKRFLQGLNDYVTGKTATFDMEDLTEGLANSTEKMSQFFARDQLARFNKATTLATFQAAGVTKIKWCTTHDQRVRESHKQLDGRVFDINSLPPEIDDYNCRCGIIPVEYRT